MDNLRDIFYSVMGFVSHPHPLSWDEMVEDDILLICIGLVIFALAFVVYARFF